MDIPSMSNSQGNQKVILSREKHLLFVDKKFAHSYFYSEKRQMVLELVCLIYVYRFFFAGHTYFTGSPTS